MFKRWLPLFLVLSAVFVLTRVTGTTLFYFWEPFDLLLTVSVYAAHYLSTVGFTKPAEVETEPVQTIARKAFLPATVISAGLAVANSVRFLEAGIETLYSLYGYVAISAANSALVLIAMMCLGKKNEPAKVDER